MTPANIKKAIKNNGFRVTKARGAIIELFYKSTHPISAQEILQNLHNIKLLVNKTTVYRELKFLINQDIIKSAQLSPEVVSYELLDRDHHHHIVCNNCGKVEDVVLSTEKFLDDVKKQTSFALHSHSLEFYGHCSTCK